MATNINKGKEITLTRRIELIQVAIHNRSLPTDHDVHVLFKNLYRYADNMGKSTGGVRMWNERKARVLAKRIEDFLGVKERSTRVKPQQKTGKTARNKAKKNYRPSHARKAEKSEESRRLRQEMQGKKGK